ncbi:MAG: tetratricopeptide repeat protein [Chloroflexi bacterium]|nr:MAG: tetratricopeptide repeat protein [Chloroflexota bacterium]
MPVPVRRRLPGLRVRPGAVKRARAEAGLSLAGVARGDLSRTAIFLIETEKSNPTLPTLELIADRTGKPLDYFLDDEVPVPTGSPIDYLEIEQLLAGEALERAIEVTAELLAKRWPRADVARLNFLKGQAHIRRADAEKAAPHLLAAREYYEASADKPMVVECLSWEIHVPFLLEDPQALAVAEIALQRCRQLKPVPVPTEVRIMSRIAGIHLFQRNWPDAVRIYEEAVERLGSLKDMSRMAKVYAELGMAYREMGQLDLSARYSQKSIALHEMLRDQYSIAMVENNLALALMNMKNFNLAQEHLDHSLELLEGIGRERGKSHVLLSIAELHYNRSQLEQAQDFATRGLALARRLRERATEAEAHQWLGRVAAANGNAETTDREFESALEILGSLKLGERLVQAHAAYAQILEERGDLVAANHHLKQVLAASRPDLVARASAEDLERQLA